MIRFRTFVNAVALAAVLGTAGQAFGAEQIKLAVGGFGYWDTAVSEMAKRSGILEKHGIEAEILYTQGAGETMQAVLSGSVDIGVGAGMSGVLSAFAKGAPVRVVSSESIGSSDYWYVRSDSPLKSIADATANTALTYSTNGSSSYSEVLGFIEKYKLKSKALATGNVASTFTQVMSGQLDVGFAAPPFGFAELADGKIRIIGLANDIDSINSQSMRVNISNANFVDKRAAVLAAFIDAYRETLDWMYSSDAALKVYADITSTTVDFARKARNEFYPKEMLNPDKISGIQSLQTDAVNSKVLQQPLTDTQFAQLIVIPPRK